MWAIPSERIFFSLLKSVLLRLDTMKPNFFSKTSCDYNQNRHFPLSVTINCCPSVGRRPRSSSILLIDENILSTPLGESVFGSRGRFFFFAEQFFELLGKPSRISFFSDLGQRSDVIAFRENRPRPSGCTRPW